MKITGLTDAQVQENKAKYGDNSITEQAREGFWDKLKGNFDDPIIKILIFALVLNVFFAFMGKSEWYESVGIAMAVLLATFVSTFSEFKNESAFQKLQGEASLIKCKVYRNGAVVEIPINDITMGDCVLLQSGDKIPADGIIIDGTINVDQSILNGEAKEEAKVPPPDAATDEESAKSDDLLNPHKVFRGAVVAGGNAVMRTVTLGDKTFYGKIAEELQTDEDRDTPLKLKLGDLAGQISKFGYIGGVLIAVAFMFQRIVIHNNFDMALISAYCSDIMNVLNSLVEAVMLAVIIIVMAVPEGLPLMIAIVSAQNMGKMLKDNVLVRKISGIETAGSLNLLFSDKTGTITKGQLEAVSFLDGTAASFKSYSDIPKKLAELISLSVRYNTAAVVNGDKAVGGNATERALLGFVLGKESGELNIKVGDTVPFNSKNKYSLAEVTGDYTLTLAKGAPERLLDRCSFYYDGNGNKQPLSGVDHINAEIDKLAVRAIRVLALATYEGKVENGELPDKGLIFVGAVGIRDEVRAESPAALAQVREAGVQVIMITGDRKETAMAISKEAGLLKSDDEVVLTSPELNAMSDDEVKKILPKIRVIARALPTDKSRLVRIAQEMNLVVGMTGDGVNDSPALKKADVGFAMGDGTEVAKEASEIVILDNNFSSIGKAILYGRTIFNSIRKFIIFQLTINVSAVMISFVCPLIGMENPLTITQILWVNLVMDTLAALAFGGEPALARYMEEQPKRRDEKIINGYMYSEIGVGAVWCFAMGLVFLLTSFSHEHFRVGEGDDANMYLMTGYFAFFIFMAVFNAFNARTDRMNLFDNIGGNTGFLKVMGLIVVVQVAMTYFGGVILRCFGLTAGEWLFVIAMAFTIIPIDLIRKAFVGDSTK